MARNAPTVRVTYRGPVSELQGTQWEIPAAIVKDANPASYIESMWRENRAKAVATAEQHKRDQEVLQARIDAQRVADGKALEIASEAAAEASALRAELAEVRALLSEPDIARQVEISNGTTLAMGRTFDLQVTVAALSERVEILAAQTQEMADACAVQADANTALLKSQQELVAGSFGTFAEALQVFQEQLTAQEQTIINLTSKIADNWETVSAAANINQTAIAQARQAATDLVTDQLDQFRVFLSVALQALGVSESDFSAALTRMDQGLQQGAFTISQSYIANVVRLAKRFEDARADAERRTNESASMMNRVAPPAAKRITKR